MILWFPANKSKDIVLNYIQSFAKGTFAQIVQDRIHSRFPSFIQKKVYLDADFQEIDTLCSICYENGDYQLKCGHFFHAHCIAKWRERSRSCPLCRAAL